MHACAAGLLHIQGTMSLPQEAVVYLGYITDARVTEPIWWEEFSGDDLVSHTPVTAISGCEHLSISTHSCSLYMSSWVWSLWSGVKIKRQTVKQFLNPWSASGPILCCFCHTPQFAQYSDIIWSPCRALKQAFDKRDPVLSLLLLIYCLHIESNRNSNNARGIGCGF